MSAPAATPPTPPLLELCDVVVESPRRATADSQPINWRVNAGDFWVVGGLPGAGKSELLATAAGLLQPALGQLRLFGQEVGGLTEPELLRARMRVGLVFADGGRLVNQLTVAENVALPLCYHRDCAVADVWDTVQALLELTDLLPLAHNTPGAIGRGWRQRAALARALALQPEVLLLDEPVAGLDPRHIRWWLDLLARLAAGHPLLHGNKLTLVVATGDLRPWSKQGRQFALLQPGGLHPLGDWTALAASADPLLQELLATETVHLTR